MSAQLLALDPGMKFMGWAVFERLVPGEIHPGKIKAALVGSGRASTGKLLPTTWSTERRLVRLSQFAQELIRLHSAVELVAIELPPYAGSYSERAKRQKTKQAVNARSLQLLNLSIGALVIGAAQTGATVRLVAATRSKEYRLHVVRGYWPRFRLLEEPNDESDAVYLGLQVATDARKEERGVQLQPG